MWQISISILFSSQLMAKEPLEKLGFKDLIDPPSSQAEKDTKPWPATPQLLFHKGCFSELCVSNTSSNEAFQSGGVKMRRMAAKTECRSAGGLGDLNCGLSLRFQYKQILSGICVHKIKMFNVWSCCSACQ